MGAGVSNSQTCRIPEHVEFPDRSCMYRSLAQFGPRNLDEGCYTSATCTTGTWCTCTLGCTRTPSLIMTVTLILTGTLVLFSTSDEPHHVVSPCRGIGAG